MNRVGISGPGFPLSIERKRQDGVWVVMGTALRAWDLVDAAAGIDVDIAAVTNLHHTSWMDDHHQQFLSPAQIAQKQGVEAQVHDAAWASRTGQSDPTDLLVLDFAALPAFFRGWGPYEVDILGLTASPSAAELDSLLLALNTRRLVDAPLLASERKMAMYYNGHDDCYFYVESRFSQLAGILFTRLLGLIAGAVLVGGEGSVELPEPDLSLCSDFVDRSDKWTGTAKRETNGIAVVELAPESWRLGKELPRRMPVAIAFDPADDLWSITDSA